MRASPLPSEAIADDGVGNRLTGPDPGDSYTYNAGHQLLTGPGTTYTYDASGNRATKTDPAGTTTYTRDAVERLVQAAVTTASGTATVTFTSDALGRRIARSVVVTPTSGPVVTTTTTYVYDGEDLIWEEVTTDAGGAPVTTTTRVVHGPGIDEPLLVETGGQVLAVHADGLGSVTGLSDASQTLVEERAYTAFGRMQRSGSWPGVTYGYTGREWAPELGLYDYRARYYDPEAGRFLSRDPIGFAGGIHLYAYVDNSPLGWTDPFGLAKFCCRLLHSTAFGSILRQRHCYIVADDGTVYGLYPSESGVPRVGLPRTNDPRDTGGQCFDCPPNSCDQNACLRDAHRRYPISTYDSIGPNSNTYAGTLARSCCKGGVPAGAGEPIGSDDKPY